jgi:hypothetical protein
MPENSSFTEQYIRDWVLKALGSPTIQVELEETQIDQKIQDVLELFQKYKPKEYFVAQEYARGYHYITAPTDAIGVLDVEFVRSDYLSYENVEGALLYDPFYFLSAGGITGMDVTTYDLVRHWIEVISREFGSEEGCIFLDDGNLFIQVPGNFKVTIKWAMPWNSLADCHRPYQHLFLNLVLAKCKQILGHIRGKFAQGVPGAGGMVQLDGEYMKQSGKEEEAQLTEELKRISPHFIPSLG